jgi:hypothetical protein
MGGGRRVARPRPFRRALAVALTALGCAHPAGSGAPPSIPEGASQSIPENVAPATDIPPPKGTPPPRGGGLPLPGPNPGAEPLNSQEQLDRFPIQAGAAHRDADRRRKADTGAVEVVGAIDKEGDKVPTTVCDEARAKDLQSCPIRADAVETVVDIARGVRMGLRKGSVRADELDRALVCQKLVAASARQPALCPFLDAGTDARVITRNGRVAVELVRDENVHALREQVRAFARR